MKFPSYDVGNGQENIDYPSHTHNSPTAVAFNPGTPSKTPTAYGGKKDLAGRRAARKNYEKAAKTKKLGEGSRFEALAKSAAVGGATNPAAVAAAAGRKAHGKAKMAEIAAAGRKHA